MSDWQYLLSGIIFMIVLGPAVGNYATSVVYRLPRQQTPFEKHPYCGHCGTMLAPRDLFPLLSYFRLKGRCRYCAQPIRFTYTAIELSCGAIFVTNFLLLGISEDFILLTAIGVFFTILCGLEVDGGRLFPLIISYLFALGALLRTLHDGSIYPFFFSGFIMLFLSVVLWRIRLLFRPRPAPERAASPGASGVADTPHIPDTVWLASLMGVMLPMTVLPYAAACALVFYGLQRLLTGWRGQSIAAAAAVYLGLLLAYGGYSANIVNL